MALLQDYALPVHKSLQQPDLILGIPKTVLALILCATMILVYLLGAVFAASGFVIYIPCYFLSREDPDMLTIALDSLFQVDYLEG
jgi:type IV secretory pathway VirB3-like protein